MLARQIDAITLDMLRNLGNPSIFNAQVTDKRMTQTVMNHGIFVNHRNPSII